MTRSIVTRPRPEKPLTLEQLARRLGAADREHRAAVDKRVDLNRQLTSAMNAETAAAKKLGAARDALLGAAGGSK